MRTPRHARTVALVAVAALAGCLKLPEPAAPDHTAELQPAIALLADGTAFDAPGARERLVALLSESTGRPVRILTTDPPAEAVLKPIAKPQRSELGHYPWREPRCTKKARPMLTAIAARAEAIYRVRLNATVTTREATDDDRVKLAHTDGAHHLLGAVGIGRPDTVFETRLEGTIERTTFPGVATVQRQRVHVDDRRLGRASEPPPIDLRTAVGGALAAMPPAAAPKWDGVARWLSSKGCPFAAFAVSDTLVSDAAQQRRLKTAAMFAMQRQATAERHVDPPAAATQSASQVD
jgi:hypothetical protein